MKRIQSAILPLLAILLSSTILLAQSSVGVKKAEELINKGDYMQALVKLDSITQLAPDNAEAFSLLGKAKANLGDCAGAIEAWDKYATLDQENSWQVFAMKADCYVHQGHHDEAIEALSKYIVHDPYHGHSYMLRGQEYYLTSKYAQAIQDFSMVINRKLQGYSTFEVFYKRGITYADNGMNQEALNDFNKVIELYPQFNYGYFYRGVTYWQLGNTKMAIADFSKSIELDSKDLHAYFNRGLCYKEERAYSEAIADFSKVIQIDPNFDEAYNQVAMTMYYKGDWDDAEKSFDDYISKFSNYSHAYFNRGMYHTNRKNNIKALADFDYCLKLNPKDGDAFLHKGLILLEQKKKEEACEALSQAASLGNTDAQEIVKKTCPSANK